LVTGAQDQARQVTMSPTSYIRERSYLNDTFLNR
jgi:hypothetical protein